MLHAHVSKARPDVLDDISVSFTTDTFVALADLMQKFETTCSYGMTSLLSSAGFSPLRLWGWKQSEWWGKSADAAALAAKAIADRAPFEDSELEQYAEAQGFPEAFPKGEAFASPGSPIVSIPLGWVRRRSKIADAAHLWLRSRTVPATADDISRAIGATSSRALAEVLRHSPARFFQVRPEGTWALTEWKQLNESFTYQDATEAVIAVVRELGPMTETHLVAATLRRYPVTTWRINQCLAHSSLGLTTDGRIDLVERGATPIPCPEPMQPPHIAEAGIKVAIKLSINHEMLRGSGIGVHTWLTWRFGLHHYPSTMPFSGTFPVILRRHSSGASISSLRAAVHALGLSLGCLVVVLLDRESLSASILHGCNDSCPQGPPLATH